MTKIIADVGSNFEKFEDLSNAASILKQCGVDAVKYQLYSPLELYGYGDQKLSISLDDLKKLEEKADACKIEFMCSAFSLDGYKAIDPLVRVHKLASSHITHKPILEYLNSTKKPVILSTGASSETEIRTVLAHFDDNSKITLLYCVSSYPAKDINLMIIDKMRDMFKVKIGFSDHSDNITIPVEAAINHKAEVIEKHYKVREDISSPDSGHSLDTHDMNEMVKRIKNPGTNFPFGSRSEREFMLKHKIRCVTVKPIKAGDILKHGVNFGIFRTKEEDTQGMSGLYYDMIDGKPAIADIEAYEPISPSKVRIK